MYRYAPLDITLHRGTLLSWDHQWQWGPMRTCWVILYILLGGYPSLHHSTRSGVSTDSTIKHGSLCHQRQKTWSWGSGASTLAGGWQWWTHSAVGWHTRDEGHEIKFDKYGRRKFQIQVVSRERNAVNMLKNFLAFNTFIRWTEMWEGGRIWCMCCGLWELCPHHVLFLTWS